MLRYTLKRCLQMIPTVAGVVLVTFVLFNLVGGSPASMTLGQHVSSQALEEFDEQRGFNKPLLFGWWTRTRALEDTTFAAGPGPWRGTAGASYAPPAGHDPGRLVLAPDSAHAVPLAFPLKPDAGYRLTIRYRLAGGGSAKLQVGRESKRPGCSVSQGQKQTISPSPRWKTIRLDIQRQMGKDVEATPPSLSAIAELTGTNHDGMKSGGGAASTGNGTGDGTNRIPIQIGMPGSMPSAASGTEGKGQPACAEPVVSLVFQVKGRPLEIRSVSLRRKMAHPLDSQLVFYLRQLARLDFGVSSAMNQPVSRLLRQGIGPSLALTVPILLVELVVSVVLSLVCAFFRNTVTDRFLVVLSVALMSVNYLVWIVAGQYLLAYRLRWFPLWGFESWSYLFLPVLIGVVSGLGANVRFYRAIMLDEMYRDYVRTAFAKGVGRAGVLFRHVLKNAMIPIITNVAIALPFLYTGSLLLESFFGIPGLGYLSVNALNSADIDVVRAVVLVGSILFVVANLLADLCYALVDPRVKLGG